MKATIARSSLIMSTALLLGAGLGCRARTSPQPDALSLAVQNSSDFQVNVFAVPSAPSLRIRLGSIPALSNGQLKLPSSALAAGGVLRVLVDPIGSTREWVSSTVNVSPDLQPCLHVQADVDGDLSRSTLVTGLANGAGCP